MTPEVISLKERPLDLLTTDDNVPGLQRSKGLGSEGLGRVFERSGGGSFGE